jgi:cyclopropane fatty-acyl-phospholipid synthase-like methyltransferase
MAKRAGVALLIVSLAAWIVTSHMLCLFDPQPFHYVVESEDDWMTKNFFAGGQTPSADLLLHFQKDLSILRQWYVNGVHYAKTLEDWLVRHTTSKAKIIPLFEQAYGKEEALKWYVYWRLFYLACAEFFAREHGERFGVGHYLFQKSSTHMCT